jgi:hypothetical protein
MNIVRTGEIAFLGLAQADADFQAQRDAREQAQLRPYAFTPLGKCKNHYAAWDSSKVEVTNVEHRSFGRKVLGTTRFIYPAH